MEQMNGMYNVTGNVGDYVYSGTTTTTSIPYQGDWGSPCYTITYPPEGALKTTTKGITMKGNGKEYLVFAKGANTPVKACDTEAEALEEASALADKNDDTYFVYRAVKRVAPVRTDLTVEDL